MNQDQTTFMGVTISELAELKRFAAEKDVTHLLVEIAALRGRLSYYERRVQEMNKFLEANKEK